jgi:5-methylcytosine-specific restriction enzyme A
MRIVPLYKTNDQRESWRLWYGQSLWRKNLRPAHLAMYPLCAFCDARGIVKSATVVDHKIPHQGDLDLFSDPDNLQSLCKQCHDGAKQAQESGGTLRGCGLDGTPIDPSHPWFKNHE